MAGHHPEPNPVNEVQDTEVWEFFERLFGGVSWQLPSFKLPAFELFGYNFPEYTVVSPSSWFWTDNCRADPADLRPAGPSHPQGRLAEGAVVELLRRDVDVRPQRDRPTKSRPASGPAHAARP